MIQNISHCFAFSILITVYIMVNKICFLNMKSTAFYLNFHYYYCCPIKKNNNNNNKSLCECVGGFQKAVRRDGSVLCLCTK